MATEFRMELLPSDPLLHILSFLDFGDLIQVSSTNRRLNELSKHNPLWRSLCFKHWLTTELVCICSSLLFKLASMLSDERLQSGRSWYNVFREYYADLGRYIHYYPLLKRAWEQLTSFLRQRCPRMIVSLKVPVSFGFSRRCHGGRVEQHRGSDRLSPSGRLSVLVPHTQRPDAGDTRVDGEHVAFQPLPLRGSAGCGDSGGRFPAQEGDEILPPAHLLLPHGPQPVHGPGAHGRAPHVRELLPLPRSDGAGSRSRRHVHHRFLLFGVVHHLRQQRGYGRVPHHPGTDLQPLLPALPEGSRGVPEPAERHSLSSVSRVVLGVSYRWDMPGTPHQGGVREASESVSPADAEPIHLSISLSILPSPVNKTPRDT
ncbi:F-box only protein 3 isoform X4 [Syngnathoides biaculeatus]|uniref:F-box only protein 3 isoform X4 n=1 Tax=Syngnathoides biaculeatus TaxID=300417 RepID=UPI002ADDCF67|nr:F-box only protein 3 isoform X4 [Syngnathoides biaculeatus]